ncbi:MAG: hypothetical protein M1827_003183 [Pycnora praestabilis]|nr:MAG: hypothetical protein M1827_003183 [Pycnora praestabilis]
MITGALLLAAAGYVHAVAIAPGAVLEARQASTTVSTASPTVNLFLQTSPEVFQGPTATGTPAFLAETNPAPFSGTFAPNRPLETALPIAGDTNNASIFQYMGNLSPYFPNPSGFGVNEYPLPSGSNITLLNMLSRHGSRYPTTGSGVVTFGAGILSATTNKTANFTGALSFLNTWSYKLGAEILVPVGNQELFDSGVLHQYEYGQLYNPNTKIVARTTSEDRMLKSAEYFLAGFFGLSWSNNATLEIIIEQDNFNISLAGYDNCNNSNLAVSAGGSNASAIWEKTYLANATARFQAMSSGYNWTTAEVYDAQTLCPYETVAFGYSSFCDLFTFQEWEDFEYSIDLSFAGGDMFQSPTGRAVGIGYQQEFLARLQNHTLTTANTQANITLDNNTVTFPLNQSLYFDFSHDTNIASILTAFGLTQFAQLLPTSGPPPNQQLIVSHMEPFGARLDIEVINAPQPVSANRTGSQYTAGPPTKYIHFILNQRTIPLGVSFPSCGARVDGWCELNTFIATQANALALADYNFACNGNYPAVPYGNITNGAPQITGPAKKH